jgi:hypothetical protein
MPLPMFSSDKMPKQEESFHENALMFRPARTVREKPGDICERGGLLECFNGRHFGRIELSACCSATESRKLNFAASRLTMVVSLAFQDYSSP